MQKIQFFASTFRRDKRLFIMEKAEIVRLLSIV